MNAAAKADAPAAVRKVLGDSLSYIEEGVYDPKTKRYRYGITPSKLADRVSIKGDFWVEPKGDAKCERLCAVDLDVKIFGVGRIIEGFIEKTTRESYDQAAAFTQKLQSRPKPPKGSMARTWRFAWAARVDQVRGGCPPPQGG